MASIGQITGTQVHSGPKHILQCRVSEDILRILATKDTKDRVHQDKMLYCMHKHELALNCSIPLCSKDHALFRTSKQAYPTVITTLGYISPVTKTGLEYLYASRTWKDWHKLADHFTNEKILPSIPDFTMQGVVQTQAWATTNFGDNIGSILVAGFATIMNGHFHAYTGDLVHWYFEFEQHLFNEDSTRNNQRHLRWQDLKTTFTEEEQEHSDFTSLHHDDLVNLGKKYIKQISKNFQEKAKTEEVNMPPESKLKRNFHEMREYGNYPELYKNHDRKTGSRQYKQNVVYPKPFRMIQNHFGDAKRVFGKVVNGGRPFEPIDVLIFSQCR